MVIENKTISYCNNIDLYFNDHFILHHSFNESWKHAPRLAFSFLQQQHWLDETAEFSVGFFFGFFALIGESCSLSCSHYGSLVIGLSIYSALPQIWARSNCSCSHWQLPVAEVVMYIIFSLRPNCFHRSEERVKACYGFRVYHQMASIYYGKQIEWEREVNKKVSGIRELFGLLIINSWNTEFCSLTIGVKYFLDLAPFFNFFIIIISYLLIHVGDSFTSGDIHQ